MTGHIGMAERFQTQRQTVGSDSTVGMSLKLAATSIPEAPLLAPSPPADKASPINAYFPIVLADAARYKVAARRVNRKPCYGFV